MSESYDHWIIFVDAEHRKNMDFEKILPNFKSNSSPEDGITQKWKVRIAELIFHVASENVDVFDTAPW